MFREQDAEEKDAWIAERKLPDVAVRNNAMSVTSASTSLFGTGASPRRAIPVFSEPPQAAMSVRPRRTHRAMGKK